MAAVGAVGAMTVGLTACGGPSVADAEQAASIYFSAPPTGEWAAAAAESTGIAQSRAFFYAYASGITGLPSGTLFPLDPTAVTTAQIEELQEVDGVLRATGTMTGGQEFDLADVEFAETDDGVKVANYVDTSGLTLDAFWEAGDSVDTGGGVTLRTVAGRMSRTTGQIIPSYQWVSVVQNDNSWVVTLDSIVFTPTGGTPVTWKNGQAVEGRPERGGTAVAAQLEAAPGGTASIWVGQGARPPEGSGTLTVTVSGAGTSRELSVQLPTLTPPAGWSAGG